MPIYIDPRDYLPYKSGDSHARPWGHYKVIAAGLAPSGEEFCEKHLSLAPRQILSLQSHALRREKLRVISGTAKIIIDGKILTLSGDDEIDIPKTAFMPLSIRMLNFASFMKSSRAFAVRMI